MPFPHIKEDYTPEEWKSQIEKAADACAEKYSLDKSRVRDVYHKLDATKWYTPDFPSKTAFEMSFIFLEPQRALVLFESDLKQLMNRLAITQQFYQTQSLPFFTRPELIDITVDFISYQDKHRENIVKTGFPKLPFYKSQWFDWQLGTLYFVKLPIDYPFFPPEIGFSHLLLHFSLAYNPKPERDFYSIYVKNPENVDINKDRYSKSFNTQCYDVFFESVNRYDEGIFYDSNGKAVAEICNYRDAPFLDFFRGEQLVNVNLLRGNLFDARLKILKSIRSSLHKEDVTDLWSDCLKILTDNILKEDIEWLKYADSVLDIHIFPEDDNPLHKFYNQLYGDIIPASHPYRFISSFENNSGLDDLISYIGWMEIELKTNIMSDTKNLLSKLPLDNNLFSYYQIIDKPFLAQFNNIIDSFSDAYEQIVPEFDKFYKRVYQAYETEFFEPPILKDFVRSKYIDDFNLAVTPFSESAATQLEAKGQVFFALINQEIKKAEFHEDENKIEPTKYVFKNMGDFWEVTYEGKTQSVKDTLGMHYIKHLLMKPNKDILAYELERIGKNQWENVEHSMADEIFDETTLQEIRGKLKDFNKSIAIAEEFKDEDKIRSLTDAKTKFMKDCSEGTKPGGGSRHFKSELKQVRDRVSKNIRTARDNIEDKHKQLGSHLKNSITSSDFCKYHPEELPPWKF